MPDVYSRADADPKAGKPSRLRQAARDPRTRTSSAFFDGEFVPLAEARIPIMTHGFLYGTATFEGIRAYWNEEQEQLYGLKLPRALHSA